MPGPWSGRYAIDTPSTSTRNPSVGSVCRIHRDRTLAPLTAKSSGPTDWNVTSPRSWSGRIGKYGLLITPVNTWSSEPPACSGP